MVAWQRAEVPESTTAITPRNSGAWTPWKRFLWFDHRKHGIDGSRQCSDNERDRSHAGTEGESLGGDLGSTVLFSPQFIMSFKLMYTRMLQLLKWSSPLASHTWHKRRGQDFWSTSPRRQLMWLSEVPHISCTGTSWTTVLHIFQWPDLTQITCLHNPHEIQVLINVCSHFWTRADFLT